MREPDFTKWKGVLWRVVGRTPTAYCPTHKHRLDIINKYGFAVDQSRSTTPSQSCLLCPAGDERFAIDGGSFDVMVRRYEAAIESESLKGATYRDLDNIYTPVLRVSPKPKDDRYSIQVEIDSTPQGKKMVIYAADRQNPSEKTQVFIDPQNDKISFDGNDLHPNMVFAKITAEFKDNKSATLEQKDKH